MGVQAAAATAEERESSAAGGIHDAEARAWVNFPPQKNKSSGLITVDFSIFFYNEMLQIILSERKQNKKCPTKWTGIK